MATRKRRGRQDPRTPHAPTAAAGQTLPADLLLEIVARSNFCTLLRCAASCKLLRHEILGSAFVRRVTQRDGVVPSVILACLNDDEDGRQPHLSLVCPATPTALSFFNDHLSTRMSRSADSFFGDYCPVTSRAGLILLRRRQFSSKLSNLCVYDLVTGHHTLVSNLLGSTRSKPDAADGIGCSFSLFVPYLGTMPDGSNPTRLQTATYMCGTWAPASTSYANSAFFSLYWKEPQQSSAYHLLPCDAVVLPGGVIHWLVGGSITFYNVYTAKRGIIEVPDPFDYFIGELHLGSYYSHDGQKLLRLLFACEFKISVWHQLPGWHWASEPVIIDMEEKLQSLDTGIPPGETVYIYFKCSSEASNAVLLDIDIIGDRTLHIIFDLETKDICMQPYSTFSSMLLEVDLLSKLRAMKVFA